MALVAYRSTVSEALRKRQTQGNGSLREQVRSRSKSEHIGRDFVFSEISPTQRRHRLLTRNIQDYLLIHFEYDMRQEADLIERSIVTSAHHVKMLSPFLAMRHHSPDPEMRSEKVYISTASPGEGAHRHQQRSINAQNIVCITSSSENFT